MLKARVFRFFLNGHDYDELDRGRVSFNPAPGIRSSTRLLVSRVVLSYRHNGMWRLRWLRREGGDTGSDPAEPRSVE
jgi:hypothetical protein